MCVCLQKEIRSSLVLSMLQQMLAEDKADMVREAVVKSLGIIMGYIDDPDKYSQVCATFAFLHNSVFFFLSFYSNFTSIFLCTCAGFRIWLWTGLWADAVVSGRPVGEGGQCHPPSVHSCFRCLVHRTGQLAVPAHSLPPHSHRETAQGENQHTQNYILLRTAGAVPHCFFSMFTLGLFWRFSFILFFFLSQNGIFLSF